MAESLAVENQICGVCGAEVRDEALFCYNCGSQVRSAAVAEAPSERAPAKPSAKEPAPANGAAAAKPKLETAAELRRRKKTLDRKPVEVVWTEPESFSARFAIFTVVIAAIVLGLLGLAFYLK